MDTVQMEAIVDPETISSCDGHVHVTFEMAKQDVSEFIDALLQANRTPPPKSQEYMA